MSIAILARAACAASLISVTASAAWAAYLGPGTWIGEFAQPGGGFVQEADVEANTGADVTMIGGWEGGPDGPFTFDVLERETGHATTVQWDYTGIDPLELYLSVKYGGQYSIYHYAMVTAPDFGIFSSNPADAGAPITTRNNGDPYNLAQMRIWSVSDRPAPVPVPPALVLLGTAIASLFGLRRMRRRTSATA